MDAIIESMKDSSVIITILADNTATPPYTAEHGFSAFIELRDTDSSHFLLFDTGRGVLFDNALLAGVDLAQVKDIILSHGHYDHTDALDQFLEKYPNVRIHASSHIFRKHYSMRTGTVRPISLSNGVLSLLKKLSKQQFLSFTGMTSCIDSKIYLAENIPHINPLETPSPLLC